MLKKQCVLVFTFILIICSSLFSNPVYANSTMRDWYGTDATGIITDEDCPLTVQHESLYFYIPGFPANYYGSSEDYSQYESFVSATYTFYNPEDYTVNATLLFPFGNKPSYLSYYSKEDNSFQIYDDTEKYGIYINDHIIDATLRHTWHDDNETFDTEKYLSKLNDNFIEDTFYTQEMDVTEFVYQINESYEDKNIFAEITFANVSDKTRIYASDYSGVHFSEDANTITLSVPITNQTFSYHIIGEVPLNAIQIVFKQRYRDEDFTDQISYTLIEQNISKLKNLLFTKYEQYQSIVLEYDWYNAMIHLFQNRTSNDLFIEIEDSDLDIYNNLMRWYEYNIEVSAKQTIENTVTAPIYPDIMSNTDPYSFRYTYLLSPAKSWKEFHNLDIIIDTPFYMINKTNETFSKTDSGYSLSYASLPNSELIFTLCEDENPESTGIGKYLLTILGGILIFLIAIIIIIILFIVLVVKWIKKSRKKSKDNEVR